MGIDLDTIDEINQVNEGLEEELDIDLPIELEDLEESNTPNTHWDGLVGITEERGKLYESLSLYEKRFYLRYLLARPEILGGDIRFIDYLEEHQNRTKYGPGNRQASRRFGIGLDGRC